MNDFHEGNARQANPNEQVEREAFEKAMVGRKLLVRAVPEPSVEMLYNEHYQTWKAARAHQSQQPADVVEAAREWATARNAAIKACESKEGADEALTRLGKAEAALSKSALSAMQQPATTDLIHKQFKACSEVNIPTREKMGLPPLEQPTAPAGALTEEEAVSVMVHAWFKTPCGQPAHISMREIYRALTAAMAKKAEKYNG